MRERLWNCCHFITLSITFFLVFVDVLANAIYFFLHQTTAIFAILLGAVIDIKLIQFRKHNVLIFASNFRFFSRPVDARENGIEKKSGFFCADYKLHVVFMFICLSVQFSCGRSTIFVHCIFIWVVHEFCVCLCALQSGENKVMRNQILNCQLKLSSLEYEINKCKQFENEWINQTKFSTIESFFFAKCRKLIDNATHSSIPLEWRPIELNIESLDIQKLSWTIIKSKVNSGSGATAATTRGTNSRFFSLLTSF